MIRIKNTADDRRKAHLHRTASRFQMEPTLGSTRIRLRGYVDITDEHYERVKDLIEEWVAKGMVEVIRLEGPAAVLPRPEEAPPPVVNPEVSKEMKTEVVVEEPKAPEVLDEASSVVEEKVETAPEAPKPVSTPEPPKHQYHKGSGKKKLF